MSAYLGGNECKWWLQNPDLVVNNPILNLKYLTASSQELHVCFSSQIVSDAYNSNTSYLKLLAIDRIFCYNWNIITAFRYISKQKMISLNTCQYYNELQKIYNDLDNFFITAKKNDTLVCIYGYVLRKDLQSTTRTAMYWTPEGRERGETKNITKLV